MPHRNAMVEHSLELLAPLGTVRARPMFGGHGLTLDGHFIALIAFDRLYLKTDALSRPRFAEAEGLALGRELVAIAEAEGLGIVIDIRTADRTLFHAALPGSAPP